jgi:hypothetical protein
MIEKGLHTFLTGTAAISALVSARVYPVWLPQSPTLPCLTYQRISGSRVRSLTGPSSLAHPRIQIDCWAATYDGAKTLAEAVRVALDGYSGLMGTVEVFGVIVHGDRDLYDPEVKISRVSMDITIWHIE